MRPQAGGVRDAFAWREALSPAITPTGSARGSARGGASEESTPRSEQPPTPPGGRSPVRGAEEGSGSRSSRSGLSARSGHSARSQGGAYAGYPSSNAFYDLSARSGVTSASQYATPEPSARTSAFESAYEPSVCASARNAEAFDREVSHSGTATQRRRHKAMSAAFDAFAPPAEEAYGSYPVSPAASAAPAEVEASLDPKVLYSAARHGKHKEVEASLAAGFDPLFQDQFGNTLFHVACQNGNKRVAKLAIKYGGDMDHQNTRGNTGLHFLFSYGYTEIAEYFIEKGAQEDIPNEYGKLAREGIR
mmetsp:Transcript_98044/g.211422  ORF Transcript_98044/g.211422 Transcript_98044/m.211422 type:complete len:305 (-) Transcript_98044:139-1053(-)